MLRRFTLLLTFHFLLLYPPIFAQGRVVINEYLPWPSNGCGATAEFVELTNFGPGAVNIGCYILTDGDYSITIPPNTILQPGQFYVISGQDVITQPCANINRTVTSNLNWNTCGCTSAAIPTTGDGFLTDGGSASEQVVLLRPDLQVVDAIVRTLPAEASQVISTASIAGGCAVKTFRLDTIAVSYETVGESAGRGNSFARDVDAGCRWIKETQQSGGDPNDISSGTTTGFQASLSITQPRACGNQLGEAVISVNANDLPNVPSVDYYKSFDADNNSVFDVTDVYTSGTDSSPASIDFPDLIAGRYNIVVGTSKGCDLQTFDFTILDCDNATILKCNFLNMHTRVQNDQAVFEWDASFCEEINALIIEKGSDGQHFKPIQRLTASGYTGTHHFSWTDDKKLAGRTYYRLKMISTNWQSKYSPTFMLPDQNSLETSVKVWPNPSHDYVIVQLYVAANEKTILRVTNEEGRTVLTQQYYLQRGINTVSLLTAQLRKGIYYLEITSALHPTGYSRKKLVKQ